MLFPSLFTLRNKPVAFQPGLDYRYAMYMGARLMFGWTVLLLWAERKPLERKGVLLVTLLVIVGEAATQAWGIAVGFVPFQTLLPAFGLQIMLGTLFIFSYVMAARIS